MTYCAIHVPSNLLLHTGDYLHRQYTLMLHPGDYALLLHAGDYPTCSITYCSTLGTTPTSSMTYCSMLGTTPTCSITYCSTLGTPPLQYDLLPPSGDHPHRRITYCSTLGTTPLQYDLLLRTGDYPHLPYNLLLTTWDYPYLPAIAYCSMLGTTFLAPHPQWPSQACINHPLYFSLCRHPLFSTRSGSAHHPHVLAVLALPASSHSWLLQSGQEFLHHPVFPLLANHHRRWGRAACRATLAHALRYAQLSSLRNWLSFPVVIVCNRHVLAIPRMRGGPTTPPTWPVVCRAGNPRNPCHAPSC